MNRFGVLNLFVAIALIANVKADDCEDSRPERINLHECCPHSKFISAEIAEKCKDEKFKEGGSGGNGGPRGPGGPGGPGGPRGPGGPGGPGGRGHFKPHSCFMECGLNETQIMNGNEIDSAKLDKYLSATFSDSPDFIPIFKEAFDKCAKIGNEMTDPSPPPSKCDFRSAMLVFCAEREAFINCPEKIWKNDDACNKNREYMKKCPLPPPPK